MPALTYDQYAALPAGSAVKVVTIDCIVTVIVETNTVPFRRVTFVSSEGRNCADWENMRLLQIKCDGPGHRQDLLGTTHGNHILRKNIFGMHETVLEVGVDAMQVHNEFRHVVKNYRQLIPLLAGTTPLPSRSSGFEGRSLTYNSLIYFTNVYWVTDAQFNDIETLFNAITESGINLLGPLNNETPTVTFSQLITASLQFSKRHSHSPTFLKSYREMFISSSLHAYDDDDDDGEKISCPKGILERMVLELSNAIIVAFDELVAEGPDTPDDLVQIIYLISGKNRDDLLPANNRAPKRKRELTLDKGNIGDWGAKCLDTLPDDADIATQKSLFKTCIIAAMHDQPTPYNEEESEEVLDAYIAGADGDALFYGGGRRRRKRRKTTRKKSTRKKSKKGTRKTKKKRRTKCNRRTMR
jgi:hypothetical protein